MKRSKKCSGEKTSKLDCQVTPVYKGTVRPHLFSKRRSEIRGDMES